MHFPLAGHAVDTRTFSLLKISLLLASSVLGGEFRRRLFTANSLLARTTLHPSSVVLVDTYELRHGHRRLDAARGVRPGTVEVLHGGGVRNFALLPADARVGWYVWYFFGSPIGWIRGSARAWFQISKGTGRMCARICSRRVIEFGDTDRNGPRIVYLE